jgi:hypothetical protein
MSLRELRTALVAIDGIVAPLTSPDPIRRPTDAAAVLELL